MTTLAPQLLAQPLPLLGSRRCAFVNGRVSALSRTVKPTLRSTPAKLRPALAQALPDSADGRVRSPLAMRDQQPLPKRAFSLMVRERVRVPVLAVGLAASLLLGAAMAPDALAARSGGRMGGSAFRSSGMRSIGGGSLSSRSGGFASSAGLGSSVGLSTGLRPSLGLGSWGMGWGLGYPMYGAPMYQAGPSLGSIFFSLIVFGVAALALNSFLQGASGQGGGGGITVEGNRVSTVKLQIGLLGIARSLQKDLERIADSADTSTASGLHYVLQETVLSLLRHPDYCVYASASSRNTSQERAEMAFNEASMEERAKIENETLVNVKGRKNAAARTAAADGVGNEFLVVTIIVAADGAVKMPSIQSLEDLKTALKRLGALRAEGVQAVEVLWTPQEDGDSLTQEELSRDYPTLKSL